MLTRQEILDVSDLDKKVVTVPEWKGDVIVKTMTGTEREAWESTLFETKGNKTRTKMENLRAKLLACCLVDEEGKRLFTDKDINSLSGKNARALDRLYDVARELNGIGQEDEDELVKN